MLRARVLWKGLLVVFFNLLVVSLILETTFVVMLRSPRLVAASPGPFRALIQQVYRHFNRSLIQFEPGCARYDPVVTYTLKPGGCTFGNVEFVNEYRVNRAGLRDTDANLDAPEVIVLGDSHAMGWGVNQDQTLVRVLANRLGYTTLNAAVSSYATVRERRMLDRLDASRLRYLVVQYADNDLPENRTFERRRDLPILSEARYREIGEYYAAQRRYYPGKYVYRLFMKVLRLEAPEPDDLRMVEATPDEEARLFLNALIHAGRTPIDGVQLVVFEINQRLQPPRPFIAALDRIARDTAYPPFVRGLRTLDTTTVLTPQDFYALDDHMTAAGHRAVGEALAKLIRAE
jgi:lysophospholipase L1-like esterase